VVMDSLTLHKCFLGHKEYNANLFKFMAQRHPRAMINQNICRQTLQHCVSMCLLAFQTGNTVEICRFLLDNHCKPRTPGMPRRTCHQHSPCHDPPQSLPGLHLPTKMYLCGTCGSLIRFSRYNAAAPVLA